MEVLPMIPEDIINGNYKNIEEENREETDLLKWGDSTDVLYSFLEFLQ